MRTNMPTEKDYDTYSLAEILDPSSITWLPFSCEYDCEELDELDRFVTNMDMQVHDWMTVDTYLKELEEVASSKNSDDAMASTFMLDSFEPIIRSK